MKFTRCAQVLSAAVFASSASVPRDVESGIHHGSSHGNRIKAISWEEAVKIMEGGGSDVDVNMQKVSSVGNTKVTPPRRPCAKPTLRVEWNNMADADKLSYVQSVKCLMDTAPLGVWANATSIWDEITWVHDQLNDRIHGVDAFLPWHRYYLHMLKTLLKEQCAYTGPMPWWRETSYTGNFAGSGLFTPEYFGSLPPLETLEGICITDGAFANTTILVGPNGPTCLSRGETKQTTDEITVATLELCQGNADTEYTQHRRCVEQTIHASMHEGLGPTMWLLATSPGDPVFFMHHGFVDWQWKRWQDSGVNGTRSREISGCAEYPGDGSPCIPLTPDTVLTTMGLVPDMTIGDVLDTENDIMCYTYDEF